MSHSVRLSLRLGQQCDLSIQEIPEVLCSLDIKPDPAGDDRIILDLTIHGRREAHDAKREVDDAIHGPAPQEQIAESDGDVVGVGKISGTIVGDHFQQSFHGPEVLGKNYVQAGLNQPYAPINQGFQRAKESSGGDK